MSRHRRGRAATLAGFVLLALVACGGNGTQGGLEESAVPTSTTLSPPPTEATTSTTASPPPTTAPPADRPTPDAVTLVSVMSGDAACYLAVTAGDGDGAEEYLPADFELCPGGADDASGLVGRKVTLERRPTKIMADSCGGNPECTDTKTVDLVVAVTPVQS